MSRALFSGALLGAMMMGCATQQRVGEGAAEAEPEAGQPVRRGPIVMRWQPQPPPPPLPPVPRVLPTVSTFRLGNGLSVRVVEQHERRAVRLRLIFPSGASNEPEAEAGSTAFALALLLETHGGTLTDGSPRLNETSVRRAVAELGGRARYDVSEDASWVGVDGFAVDVKAYLAQLLDAVRGRRHDEDAFVGLLDGARDAVDDLQLSDSEVLVRYVTRGAFGDPSAGAIAGTGESLSRIGIEEVMARQAALVQPAGATLLVVGDVTASSLRPAIESTLGRWAGAASVKRPTRDRPRPATRNMVTLLPRSNARATSLCAARPLSDVGGHSARLRLLAALLEARLTRVLRETRGLTYDVSASMVSRADTRGLLVCTTFRNQEAVTGLTELFATMSDVGKSVTDDDVELARRAASSSWQNAQQDVASTTDLWTFFLGLGRPLDVPGELSALAAVSTADLRALARQVLKPAQFQLVMSGDKRHVEPTVRALKLGTVHVPVLSRVNLD